MTAPIAVFYEHPVWFEPFFAEMDRRGVAYDRLLAHEHSFDPAVTESPYRLIVNRMSPSAWNRGHGHAIPYTTAYLGYLESIGANVLNGAPAYRYEFSKAQQLGLLARLGLRHPRARVFNSAASLVAAAEGLTYPVVVKPNIGGSGAGIVRFDTPDELAEAAHAGSVDLGFDGTALVQEYLEARGASIVRVEVLNGRYLYAIRVHPTEDEFNLCPADYCRTPGADGVSGRGAAIEGYTPPRAVIDDVLRIAREARLDIGGVEYLVNDRDGEVYYYDVNALSNFVADAPNVVGFDPFERFTDYVLERAGLTAALFSPRSSGLRARGAPGVARNRQDARTHSAKERTEDGYRRP